MKKGKICVGVGMLFRADVDFFSSGNSARHKGRRASIEIKKGEIVEIRYPSAWHFRTVDSVYCHVTEKTLLEKCSFYGEIHKNVSFQNKDGLEGILKKKLYYPANHILFNS